MYWQKIKAKNKGIAQAKECNYLIVKIIQKMLSENIIQ